MTKLFLSARSSVLEREKYHRDTTGTLVRQSRLLRRLTKRKLNYIIFMKAVAIDWHPACDLQAFLMFSQHPA